MANISQEENKLKERILLRAKTLDKIRSFFAERNVIEVATPLLLTTTTPAPYLDSFKCDNLYLQTSPEFAMKRLLALGSGDIYQICKAFRRGEAGRLHNPEFTILEWYRINFNHHDLMDEMDEFLIHAVNFPKAKRYTYEEIYKKNLEINPHICTLDQLKSLAKKHNLLISGIDTNRDTLLQILFTHLIEPKLGTKQPIFIYDFPASQAMLARVRNEKYNLASRFEVYYQGVELANGFHELKNPKEQRQRFETEAHEREKLKLPPIPIDEVFLGSLSKMPDCAGVALGIDRLLLLSCECQSLDEILCFRK